MITLRRNDLVKSILNSGYKYVQIRQTNNSVYGFNVGLLKSKKFNQRFGFDNSKTNIIGWKEISFHEYITKKLPLA